MSGLDSATLEIIWKHEGDSLGGSLVRYHFSWHVFLSTDSHILCYRLGFAMIRKDAGIRYFWKQKERIYSSAWDTFQRNSLPSLQKSQTTSYSCIIEKNFQLCTNMPWIFNAKMYDFVLIIVFLKTFKIEMSLTIFIVMKAK